MRYFISIALIMNESFEVILTNEEFQHYKQLQKDNQHTEKLTRDLRRDNQNYKIKCDQQSLAIRAQELKIKQLSKNSIRLSRRLIAEQDEHFKTQQNFLAREKELLEKLLVLSNEQQNSVKILQNSRDVKDKLIQENANLKRKNLQQEKSIQSLNLSCKQAKVQQASLQDRCLHSEGEFLAISKQCYKLKEKNYQLQITIERNTEEAKQNLQAYKRALEENRALINRTFQDEKKQLEQRYKSILGKAECQIKQLRQKNIEQVQQIEQVSCQRDKFQCLYNDLVLQKGNIFEKLRCLNLRITGIKKALQAQREDIQIKFWNFRLDLKMSAEEFGNHVQQIIAKQSEKEEIHVSNRQQLLAVIWRQIFGELNKIQAQLRKDSIDQEKEILLFEFERLINILKAQIDQNSKALYHSWMIK